MQTFYFVAKFVRKIINQIINTNTFGIGFDSSTNSFKIFQVSELPRTGLSRRLLRSIVETEVSTLGTPPWWAISLSVCSTHHWCSLWGNRWSWNISSSFFVHIYLLDLMLSSWNLEKADLFFLKEKITMYNLWLIFC